MWADQTWKFEKIVCIFFGEASGMFGMKCTECDMHDEIN